MFQVGKKSGGVELLLRPMGSRGVSGVDKILKGDICSRPSFGLSGFLSQSAPWGSWTQSQREALQQEYLAQLYCPEAPLRVMLEVWGLFRG